MEYLKYGDKFSLVNKADSKWKGYYLTVVEYSDPSDPNGGSTFCQASPKNIKNSADYLWAAIPASGSIKRIGDYVESNDLLLLKNTDATGIERYISIVFREGQAGYNIIGAAPSTNSQASDPLNFWRLSLNDAIINSSESPQKIPLDDKTSVYIAHVPFSDSSNPDNTLYIVIDLDDPTILNPKYPAGMLVANRWLTTEWGIQNDNSSNNNGGPDNNGGPQGDTKPRPIPGIPANTEFTITLINNESWLRSAKLNIDGNEVILDVAAKSAITKAYKTIKGAVTVSLLDSQHGLMLIPIKIQSTNIGTKGKTVSFGTEKSKDESRPGYMDVFVHIDWDTDITL